MKDGAVGLRIAWVVDVWDGAATGGVRSAQRFVEALRARHDVTVVTTGPAGPGRLALPAFRPPPFGRVMRRMGFAFAWPRRRALEEVLRRSDVVHVQFPFPLGLRAAALARRLRIPLVSSFHVQPENLFLNVGLRSSVAVEWTYKLFLRRLFNLSDAVICPSPFALGLLRERGLVAPAEVISNGIAPPSGRWCRHVFRGTRGGRSWWCSAASLARSVQTSRSRVCAAPGTRAG